MIQPDSLPATAHSFSPTRAPVLDAPPHPDLLPSWGQSGLPKEATAGRHSRRAVPGQRWVGNPCAPPGAILLLLLLLLWLLPGTVVIAQTLPPGVNPQQIDMFRALPRLQQEGLMRSQGLDPALLDAPLPGAARPPGAPGTAGADLPSGAEDRLAQPPGDAPDAVEDALAAEMSADPFALPSMLARARLSRFGYNLFSGRPTTFAPVQQIPVPAQYVIGPGDGIRINLWGQINRQLELRVERDGTIQFPELGSIPVAGLSFDELKLQLQQVISEAYIGVRSAIGLGELRSIQVFILGEARTPGAYTVSSLSTMTNALLASGGILPNGSLRKVQLRRQGVLVTELDLYDLLLRGDTQGDARLLPGDVLFVPPVGNTIGIQGQIRRPAIYELLPGETLGDLVDMAGGFTPDSSPRFTQMFRVVEQLRQEILDIDLSRAENRRMALRNGDLVRIGSVDDLRDGVVRIEGAVNAPGPYRWVPGLRISDLIDKLNLGLQPVVDLSYALILREIVAQGQIRVQQFHLGDALQAPHTPLDPVLQDRDQVLVFAAESRNTLLAPVLAQLALQAGPSQPLGTVTLAGALRYPGTYPLPEQATLADLLAAAGGLRDSAFTPVAELTRIGTTAAGVAETYLIDLPLQAMLDGTAAAIPFQGRDRLLIKEIPDFAETVSIRLEGEVRFPGEYTLRRNEKLGELLARAGGLREGAYPAGAIFSREVLRQNERERLRFARDQLRLDLANRALDPRDSAFTQVSISEINLLLDLLSASEPLGRMVIDLPAILAGEADKDITLQEGDLLRIPKLPQTVAVFGQVQQPTNHLFDGRLSVQDYLELSGGVTERADAARAYVVRANGSVWIPQRSAWFQGRGPQLSPGDSIVVPFKIDRVNRLELLANVSQVVYQLALGAAAVRSF